MNKINQWLAIKLGDGLSNMWFFWVCVLIDLAELPPVIKAHSVITWCTYVSQTVIQLLALPILGAQNKLQQDNHQETIKHLGHIKKHLGVEE